LLVINLPVIHENKGNNPINTNNVSKSNSDVSWIVEEAVKINNARNNCKYLRYFLGRTHLLIIDFNNGKAPKAIIVYLI
jgi:hypothetical protein